MIRTLVTCILGTMLITMTARAQRSTFHQYGASDGLLNSSVNCLMQDHTGYLWVGTDNGLFRFDGTIFQRFGHSEGIDDTEIHSLAESPDGVIWVGTRDGIARKTLTGFERVNVGIRGVLQEIVFDSQGDIYLQYDTGLVGGVKGKGNLYRFTSIVAGPISGLFLQDGQAWFLQNNYFLRLSGVTATRLGSASGLPSNNWRVIYKDGIGNLWARSKTQLFELMHGHQRFVDRSAGISPTEFPVVQGSREGRLFLNSGDRVIMLDPSSVSHSAHFTLVDETKGLSTGVVSSVLVDRENTLWIGLHGGGLVRQLGRGEWVSWRTADGLLNDNIWCVLHDRNGRLWVGSSGGLNVFAPDGRPASAWTSRNGLVADAVNAIAMDTNGQIAIGTDLDGVSWFSGNGNLQQTMRMSPYVKGAVIHSLAFDRNDRLWVAGPSGILYRSDRPLKKGVSPHFDRFPVPAVPENNEFYKIQVDDDNSIWVASSSGLIHFDGTHWRIFSREDGLLSQDVRTVVIDHGMVWIAYRDAWGIANLQFNKQRLRVFNISQKDGLSSDLVYALAMDRHGTLWASTDNGVDAIANPLNRKSIRHYDIEGGLIWNDGNDDAISVDDDGSVWIGTSRGLSRYSTVPSANKERPAAIVLTSIKSFNEQYQPGQRAVLPYNNNSISFRFSSLDYGSQTNTSYQYRLLGYNKSWEPAHGPSIFFAKLPPGHYIFEVVAVGYNGIWSAEPARFAFSIQPPWWQTLWFIMSCLVASICTIYASWQYRVRMLLNRTYILEKTVAQRTEELRQSHNQLESVAYFDALTGLPNRRKFYEEFRKQLAISRRHGVTFALVLMDLDGFKQINDTFGHDAGDAVLMDTSMKLRLFMRESDCLGRIGGDEFAILLVSPNSYSGIDVFCRHIIGNVRSDIVRDGITRKLGCSIGVAMFPEDGDTEELLYKAADIALYQSKRGGGSTLSWRSPHLPDEICS